MTALTFQLLGEGIAYSASPAMMNAAFEHLGLLHRYVLADVHADELEASVAGLRDDDAGGANVTVPHKAAVAALMDELSPSAREADAVNTVVTRDGRLVGHNTDLPATVDAIGKLCPNGVRRAVLLGAGGASRAVQLALTQSGAPSVAVLRRSDGSIERLAEEAANADLLINATPVGTGSDASPVPSALLRPDLSVLDLVYRPSPTRLVREARAVGASAVAGGAILFGQAWRSLELWLERPAPKDVMRAALMAGSGARPMPDAITLVGLSGSGKSSVGAALAARLDRPFIDLDALIAESAGSSPADLIDRFGEAHFRKLERRALEEACSVAGVVIATGGGAIIDPLNRWMVADAGISVWLDAPDPTLLARLAAHGEARPMLAGDAGPALAALRTARAPFYRASDIHVDAGKPVAAVTDELAASVDPARSSGRLFEAIVPRAHPMGPAVATIVLGRDLAADTYATVLEGVSTGPAIVAADRRAAAALPTLMEALPSERRLLFPAGERLKRLRAVERLLEAASAMGAERGDAWVGVGGGTATDLVGATAALYLRGAPFVALPTTWLGMADASVGGKVAVDLSAAKNAAGAFWPPVAIVGDVASLRTLTRSRRRDGMAESLKSGLIGDRALWELVESRGKAALGKDEAARYAAVERTVHLKLGVVERDPFEQGERRNLNLGHTLGHALEIESGYRLPHGQAVILGLRAVASIATGRGAEPDLAERIDSVAADLGFALHRDFDPVAVRTALGSDKKRHKGRQRWILPMAVGVVNEVDDVTDAELERAMRTISAATDGSGAA